MIEENVGYYPGILAITWTQQLDTFADGGMMIGKRIDSSVQNNAISHLLGKVLMLIALYKIAYEISDFDFFRIAREVYMSQIIHLNN